MGKDTYDRSRYDVLQQHMFTGNDAATMLFTPQVGTGAETKAHTNTLEPWAPGRKLTLKKINFIVKTAATGAGCSMALNIYKGATSIGSLTVDQTAALGVVASSADINVEVLATDYLRFIPVNTTTASDATAAIGQIGCTYQEKYAS